MKSLVYILPFILGFSLVFRIDYPSTVTNTKLPSLRADNCNGNACSVILISGQQGGGFTFRNTSDKKVKVTIRFAFGLGYQGNTDIHFEPTQTINFRNGGYCNPYSANYE
jgi:hypothetical protein